MLNFKTVAAAAALVAALPAAVNAHGYVKGVKIDDAWYDGWNPVIESPWQQPQPSVMTRRVATDGPILSAWDSNLRCNYDNGDNNWAGFTASANPGSWVTFFWDRWPSDHRGPVSVYIARCGDGQDSCNGFTADGNVWYKIAEDGLHDDGTWASDKLVSQGASWTVQLPWNIPAGSYLVRVEILALHDVGKPQWYPTCAQIHLSWGNGWLPDGAVSIPSIFTSAEDGQSIYGSIYEQHGGYKVPGPGVAKFAARSIEVEAPAAQHKRMVRQHREQSH